jgi:hypothetical protein
LGYLVKILATVLLAAIPFELHLPDGSTQVACGAQYTPDAKTFVFAPCVEIFADGVET